MSNPEKQPASASAPVPVPVPVPVSVLVPVKNEEAILADCLAHLQWADEVFVVDSHSTDRTAEIAEGMGAQVVQFDFNGEFPKKKNWALENLPFRNEWVLIVDADEHIRPELAGEIAGVVTGSGMDGWYLNRRFYFMGKWIRHCGYYPSWNLRLFKHRLGRYEKMIAGGAGDNEVHEHVVLDGRTGYLKGDMDHFAYPDITTWVEKHNRYSSWEAELYTRFRDGEAQDEPRMAAELQRRRLMKKIYLRLPFRFVFRFLHAYIWKRGFLDGRAGFVFCMLLMFYDFMSWAKVIEKRLTKQTLEPCD